ncbi:MAG: chemotaxis protein CheA, partial [Kangiellaceae bacterium]|nr:chemotaxis protein CheA [Kangiellaceae bacterium]
DDTITDDEFEALLDELHGGGAPKAVSNKQPVQQEPSKATAAAKAEPAAKQPTPAATKPKSAPAAAVKSDAANPEPAKKVAAAKVPAKPSMAAESTVRVDTARLDDIMNMVGELVLARNRLKMLGQNYQDEELNKAVATLDVVTSDLQGSVMKTRMQPIKKVFGRFPRVVRDLARSLKKEISLQLEGEETDLDKNLVEALADPLVHLVRNSVDHGVESPEERVAAGKPRTGKVLLSAAQEGDHILLSIQDDGKGMDPDALRKKAVEKGLMDSDQADRLSDAECFNLIFMAGFSTKEEISDVSGRGVGMDVVKTKITQLNGSLSIESEVGKGTKILIKVPLTLAILPTLMVTIGEQVFALPLASVNEIFHLDLSRTNVVDGQETIVVRDKAIPLFYLDNWLLPAGVVSKGKPEEGHVVIVQVSTYKIGFVVDALIGQEEVVIKPLGESLHGTPGMAGATITSDGGIALILDVPSLLKHYAKRS